MDGTLCPRDENDNPYHINEEGQRVQADDGVEMTMIFGVFIGALKELNERIKNLELK